MTQFHETALGRRFYERDVPELVRQLAAINETLKEIAAALSGSPPASAQADAGERSG